MTSLYVIDLTYTVELDEIEAHIDAHRAFLHRHYEAGNFLASGPKVPRTGGVILAIGEAHEIEEITAEDPFRRHGVATYAITEFLPTMSAPELEPFRAGVPAVGDR